MQFKANKERDFTHVKPIHFIVGGLVVGGLIGTVLFMTSVWLLVQYLISNATP